jgi:hypothetical protein
MQVNYALAVASIALAMHAHADAPPLFDSAEPFAITLAGPFAKIAADDAPDPEYRPALLRYRDVAGVEREIAIEVKPRGKSRRREEVCDFPPLRLDFPKKSAAETPFAGLDKVKLVTHCSRLGSRDSVAEQRLRLELVVYRLLERLTDASFRTRALDITYVDVDRGDRSARHPGFLIEPERELASRLGLERLEQKSITRAELDPERASLVEVFQYLIGNTDFSLIRGPEGENCCHNVVLLRADAAPIVPVPYDFDATGIVDPPYAEPLPSLGIRDVRQRLYRGYCREPERLAATLERFRSARESLYAVIRDDPVLNESSKRKTLEYVDAFFATIDSPEQVQRRLAGRCI